MNNLFLHHVHLHADDCTIGVFELEWRKGRVSACRQDSIGVVVKRGDFWNFVQARFLQREFSSLRVAWPNYGAWVVDTKRLFQQLPRRAQGLHSRLDPSAGTTAWYQPPTPRSWATAPVN